MIFPFENLYLDGRQLGLLVSLAVGFGFGFVLERAGFGRSTKLMAQFYLHDMTVFKVMFASVVTAMVGLVIADGVGLVELQSLVLGAASYTYIWPMLVGGLLLGVGFLVSGYCPGTSVVSAASGNFDGLVTFLGVVIGSVVFGESYQWLADFHVSGNLGHFFLPELLGLPRAVVAVLVTVMALGAFVGAEKVEKIFSARASKDLEQSTAPSQGRRLAFAVLSVAAVFGLTSAFAIPRPEAAIDVVEPAAIEAEDLAVRLVEAPWRVRVIDLRSSEAWTEERIPGSESVPADELENLGLGFVADNRDIVLVDDGDIAAIPDAAQGYRGRIFALSGGFEAWEAFAVTTPEPPAAEASVDELSRHAFRRALNGILTGQESAPPPVRPRPTAVRRPGGGGGCD